MLINKLDKEDLQMNAIGYFNSLKKDFNEARDNFSNLEDSQKRNVVIATIAGTIFSPFFLFLGGIPTFRWTVEHYTKENNKAALVEIQKGTKLFADVNVKQKNNPEILLAAVQKNHQVLKDANDELLGSRDFMLNAVKLNSDAYVYAKGDAEKDQEVIREAMKKHAETPKRCTNWATLFRHANDDLRNDSEFILELSKQDYKVVGKTSPDPVVNFASEDLWNKPEFMLKVVKLSFNAYIYAKGDAKENLEVVRTAFSGWRFSDWFESSLSDSNRGLHFLLNPGARKIYEIFFHESAKWKNNSEFILELVHREDYRAFQFAGEEPRKNPKFIFEAAKKDCRVFEFVNKEQWKERKFILDAAAADESAFDFVEESLRSDLSKDRDFMLDVIERNPAAMMLVHKDFFDSEGSFILDSIKRNPKAFKHIPLLMIAELENRDNFLLDVIENHFEALKYFNPFDKTNIQIWEEDREAFILKAIDINIKVLDYVEDMNLFGNEDFMRKAMEVNPDALKYASEELKEKLQPQLGNNIKKAHH